MEPKQDMSEKSPQISSPKLFDNPLEWVKANWGSKQPQENQLPSKSILLKKTDAQVSVDVDKQSKTPEQLKAEIAEVKQHLQDLEDQLKVAEQQPTPSSHETDVKEVVTNTLAPESTRPDTSNVSQVTEPVTLVIPTEEKAERVEINEPNSHLKKIAEKLNTAAKSGDLAQINAARNWMSVMSEKHLRDKYSSELSQESDRIKIVSFQDHSFRIYGGNRQLGTVIFNQDSITLELFSKRYQFGSGPMNLPEKKNAELSRLASEWGVDQELSVETPDDSDRSSFTYTVSKSAPDRFVITEGDIQINPDTKLHSEISTEMGKITIQMIKSEILVKVSLRGIGIEIIKSLNIYNQHNNKKSLLPGLTKVIKKGEELLYVAESKYSKFDTLARFILGQMVKYPPEYKNGDTTLQQLSEIFVEDLPKEIIQKILEERAHAEQKNQEYSNLMEKIKKFKIADLERSNFENHPDTYSVHRALSDPEIFSDSNRYEEAMKRMLEEILRDCFQLNERYIEGVIRDLISIYDREKLGGWIQQSDINETFKNKALQELQKILGK